MYGTTIGINLLFFLVVFPVMANTNLTRKGVAAEETSQFEGTEKVRISVDIPCSGHAYLITGELKKLAGVQDVKFSLPNIFEISYDSKTEAADILALEIFKTYPAKLQ